MIKYISGDILQSKDEYIAQGVAIGSQEGLGFITTGKYGHLI